MYSNLIEKADYSNLQSPGVHFTYEDHFARMVVPIRQSFNSLAATYLERGDSVMAEKVLQAASMKLYPPHLRASYTSLQAAEISMALNNRPLAESFALEGFEYYYSVVHSALESGKTPSKIDFYVLRQLAELLLQAGQPSYAEQVLELGTTFNR
jgi:hypothetical protein